MKWSHHPTHGIRFSFIDGIVIVICIVTTWYLYPTFGEIALWFPFVLGHFFLFCNVFRIRRKLELIWAGTFVVNVAAGRIFGFGLTIIALIQAIVTIAVLTLEIRSPYYHGVFSNAEPIECDKTPDDLSNDP